MSYLRKITTKLLKSRDNVLHFYNIPNTVDSPLSKAQASSTFKQPAKFLRVA